MKITLLTQNARQLVFGNSFQPIQLPHQLLSSDDHQEHKGKEWACSTNSEQLKRLRTSVFLSAHGASMAISEMRVLLC